MLEIPWISGSFHHVLTPPGMLLQANEKQAQWYINDHCIFKDSIGRLHWFGINNPYPEDGRYYTSGTHRHIGHAIAQDPFGPWEPKEHAFSLPAGTSDYLGACYVMGEPGDYLMLYGRKGHGLVFGRSCDLETWETDHTLGSLMTGRDPCVLHLDDGTKLLYGASAVNKRSVISLMSSSDLTHWKPEQPALLTDVTSPYGALESPFVHRRRDHYYLFVNFSHRQYQETLVFHSLDPYHFSWQAPLCTLFSHAAEIFTWQNEDYITHCGIEDRHWSQVDAPYGLWLAKLRWTRIE